jgi:pimeloyl-ACP methyl ester carboxylesterase
MPSLRVDDGNLEIHYRDSGRGSQAVVLLHGFPFNSGLWEPQIRELSRAYRVLAPDLRGFGRTDLSGAYSIDRLADDVADLTSALGLRRVVLIGLSMGGYVAFAFYRRHAERLIGLVLSDTRPDPDSDQTRAERARLAALARQQGSTPVVEALLPNLLSETTKRRSPEVVDALRAMMASSRPEAIAAALMAMAERDDSRPLLSSMRLPVLVTGGEEDTLTPPEQVEAWATGIPSARLAFIQGAGHVANLERPDDFNALVVDFLRTVYGEGPEERSNP